MAEQSRYDALMDRARAGDRILIDGATGSECTKRGVPEHEHGWSGAAALSHPDLVRGIHADYLALGADFIAANTFATGANILRDVGQEGAFEAVNRRAIELAIEARAAAGPSASGAVVAGGISNWSFSGNRPSLERLHDDTVAQAKVMRDAGADVLSLEMMVDLPRMRATLDAVISLDLPVWVGFSIGPEFSHEVEEPAGEIELREGGLLADAVQMAAAESAVDALCIMHTDVQLVEPSLNEVRSHWDGPLGAYAHASAIADGVPIHHDAITPEQYVDFVPGWLDAGATMIGGCCGIGPAHLALVKGAIGRS